jgi:hypothetical protein
MMANPFRMSLHKPLWPVHGGRYMVTGTITDAITDDFGTGRVILYRRS